MMIPLVRTIWFPSEKILPSVANGEDNLLNRPVLMPPLQEFRRALKEADLASTHGDYERIAMERKRLYTEHVEWQVQFELQCKERTRRERIEQKI